MELLEIDKNVSYGLRNSDGMKLKVPFFAKRTHAYCSFSVMRPTLWNSLPVTSRSNMDVNDFIKELKTFYFCQFKGDNSDFIYY